MFSNVTPHPLVGMIQWLAAEGLGLIIRVSITFRHLKGTLFGLMTVQKTSYLSKQKDQGFGKGGDTIKIFTTGGGYARGRAPSRDSKGVWGSANSSPSGVWGEAPAAFCFCVYLA